MANPNAGRTKPVIIAGVDPGNTGAIGVLSTSSKVVSAFDMPVARFRSKTRTDPVALYELILKIRDRAEEAGKDLVFAIELVSAFQGQGAGGSFNFGYGAGLIEGIVMSLQIPYHMIPPATWKKKMGLNKASKDEARMKARRMWPKQAHLFDRVRDDGRAEGLLLAEYTRLNLV